MLEIGKGKKEGVFTTELYPVEVGLAPEGEAIAAAGAEAAEAAERSSYFPFGKNGVAGELRE